MVGNLRLNTFCLDVWEKVKDEGQVASARGGNGAAEHGVVNLDAQPRRRWPQVLVSIAHPDARAESRTAVRRFDSLPGWAGSGCSSNRELYVSVRALGGDGAEALDTPASDQRPVAGSGWDRIEEMFSGPALDGGLVDAEEAGGGGD